MRASSKITGAAILILLIVAAVVWTAALREDRRGLLTVSFLNAMKGIVMHRVFFYLLVSVVVAIVTAGLAYRTVVWVMRERALLMRRFRARRRCRALTRGTFLFF